MDGRGDVVLHQSYEELVATKIFQTPIDTTLNMSTEEFRSSPRRMQGTIVQQALMPKLENSSKLYYSQNPYSKIEKTKVQVKNVILKNLQNNIKQSDKQFQSKWTKK